MKRLLCSVSTAAVSLASFKRVFTKLVALSSSVAAIGLLAAMGGASAATLSAQFGPSAGVEPTLPFALLPLGTTSACPGGCFLNNTTTSVDGVGISYSSPSNSSGEYVGNPTSTSGDVTKSPFGPSDESGIYLAATAGTIVGNSGFVPGTVTLTYSTPQTSLDILWGSVDANGGSPGYQNELMVTVDGVTYTGYDVATAALGSTANATAYDLGSNGTAIAAVEITGLAAFTSVTFEDDNTGNAFEFVPGIASTPLPATLPLLASGLGAIGLLGWRRKRKTTAIAAA